MVVFLIHRKGKIRRGANIPLACGAEGKPAAAPAENHSSEGPQGFLNNKTPFFLFSPPSCGSSAFYIKCQMYPRLAHVSFPSTNRGAFPNCQGKMSMFLGLGDDISIYKGKLSLGGLSAKATLGGKHVLARTHGK